MVSLPIAVLIVSAAVAALTQIVKYLGEKFVPAWTAEVPQVVAAVIASLLSLSTSLHLPLGVNLFVIQIVNQLGPALTSILLTAGSYVAHDLAGILQTLVQILKAHLPPAHK